MDVIQSVYIFIINFLYEKTSFIKSPARSILLTACLEVVCLYYMLEYTDMNYFIKTSDGKGRFILVMIVISAILSAESEVSKIKFNRPFMAAYYSFTLLILISGGFHPLRKGWVVFAITLLVIPMFYIVWGNRKDYPTLFNKISGVWIITGMLFYALNIVLTAPVNISERYSGLASNPNILGMITVSVIAAALYYLIQDRWQVVSTFTLGLSLMFVWLSGSRTALVADSAMIAVYLTCVIRKRENVQAGRISPLIYIALSIAISIVFVAGSSLPSELREYKADDKLREFTYRDLGYNNVNSREFESPGNNISIYGLLEGVLFSEVFADAEAYDAAGIMTSGGPDWKEDIAAPEEETQPDINAGIRLIGDIAYYDDYSSGRIGLYIQVLEHLNLFGNNPYEIILYNAAGEVKGAHNMILDFTFVSGLLCGLACLMIEIMAAIFIIKYAFGKKPFRGGISYAALFLTGFGIESLLELQVLLGSRDLVFLFWLTLVVIAARACGTTETD